MGFSTFGGALATDALAKAVGFMGDFQAPLALIFGVGVAGLLFVALKRFL